MPFHEHGVVSEASHVDSTDDEDFESGSAADRRESSA